MTRHGLQDPATPVGDSVAAPIRGELGTPPGRPRGAQDSRFPQTPPASGAAAALPWQPRPAGPRFQAPALPAGRGGAGVARRPAAGVRLRGAVSRLPPFTYFWQAETEVGGGLGGHVVAQGLRAPSLVQGPPTSPAALPDPLRFNLSLTHEYFGPCPGRKHLSIVSSGLPPLLSSLDLV